VLLRAKGEIWRRAAVAEKRCRRSHKSKNIRVKIEAEPQAIEPEILMDGNKCLKAGIWGSIIAIICCLTPVLVVGLGLIGLAAFTPYLDYILFPMLGLFLILAFYGWVKSRK